ncbi:GtrA family protein [Methylobacterium sp.]|uniref:GtrA family protein n=1 Tax=Methylobacterium sp. TaxID=409 RepID=UPI000FB7AD91|nr:GtrA family protein [Methylobacterium sp.]RUP18568.1 MAG: GtrA family protein [Methylobacterium sp.]
MFREAQAPRGEADRFARFCIVGGIGFVTDAGIMTLCIYGLGWSPTGARALSFAVAVLVTFLLNRSISFADRGGRPILPALVSYLLVQAFGFACNLIVFTLAIVRLPAPFSAPLAALALASAVALVLNYAGARFLVFSRASLPLAGRPVPRR